MKALIITVAGMATRFSESVGKKCIKCLYFNDNYQESILYRLISINESYFDKIIIVGGFMYEELLNGINTYFSNITEKINLIYNEHYFDFGSGYSLLLGIKKAIEEGSTEIVFAEGDLYIDKNTFIQLCDETANIITANREPIIASKSVAFYFNKDKQLRYIFDIKHGELEIKEPFLGIYNSGQVWKFIDVNRLDMILRKLKKEEKQGTNLVIIQKYFDDLLADRFKMIYFKNWINCNTVEDFNHIKILEGQENEKLK